MRKIDPTDMESRMGPAAVSRPLTDALGATNLAINYYELDPGDSTAYGFHAHADQEEVFYVRSGALTFETESGDVEVGAGEAIRFGPGEYQRSHNRGQDRVRVLVVGAPKEAGDTDVRRDCEDCGERTSHSLEMAEDKSAILARCERCGAVTGRFT
jgi:uncharacterized cupin superfamily protein